MLAAPSYPPASSTSTSAAALSTLPSERAAHYTTESSYPPFDRPTRLTHRQSGAHRSSWPPLIPPFLSSTSASYLPGYSNSPSPPSRSSDRASPIQESQDRRVSSSSRQDSPSPTRPLTSRGNRVSLSSETISHLGKHSLEDSSQKDQQIISMSTPATGRKRKRLQRACVPCHRAKRRCDGGLPCSNCDFSGRSCSYSDSQGNVVQPTARAPAPNSAIAAPGDQAEHGETSRQGSERNVRPGMETHSSGNSSSEVVTPQDEAEFGMHMRIFRSSAPFNAVFPGHIRPSSLLCNAISGFSVARVNSNALAAERFVFTAQKVMIDEEQSQSSWQQQSPETVLALTLMAIQQVAMGNPLKAVSYSANACRLVQELGLHEGVTMAGPFRQQDLMRLVCLTYVMDVLVTALAGKSPNVGDVDFALAASRLHGQDAVSTSFLTLLRSAHIFATAADHSRRIAFRLYRSRTEVDAGYRSCQDALESWLAALPRNLVLDDGNLAEAHRMQACEGGDAWGWSFSMMHIFTQMAVALIEGGATASGMLMTLIRTLDNDSRSSVLSVLPLVLVAHDSLVGPSVNGREAGAALASVQRATGLSSSQIEKIIPSLGFAPSGPSGAPGHGAGPISPGGAALGLPPPPGSQPPPMGMMPGPPGTLSPSAARYLPRAPLPPQPQEGLGRIASPPRATVPRKLSSPTIASAPRLPPLGPAPHVSPSGRSTSPLSAAYHAPRGPHGRLTVVHRPSLPSLSPSLHSDSQQSLRLPRLAIPNSNSGSKGTTQYHEGPRSAGAVAPSHGSVSEGGPGSKMPASFSAGSTSARAHVRSQSNSVSNSGPTSGSSGSSAYHYGAGHRVPSGGVSTYDGHNLSPISPEEARYFPASISGGSFDSHYYHHHRDQPYQPTKGSQHAPPPSQHQPHSSYKLPRMAAPSIPHGHTGSK